MITSARYFGWFVGLLGVLLTALLITNQIFGGPEFLLNGKPIETRADALVAFVSCLAFLGGGFFVARVLREQTLARLPAIDPYVKWAEELPTSNPRRHWQFYALLAVPSILLIVLAPDPVLYHRLGLVLCVPLVSLLGWGMIWSGLGFHLINPLAWLAPPLLDFAARFCHFAAVLSCLLGLILGPFLGSEQLAVGLSIAAASGGAVASSQFLRFWLRRTGRSLAA